MLNFSDARVGADMPNGSNSGRLERCDCAVCLSHRSGFPCKPPLSKWDFNACPKGGESRVVPVRQGWAALVAEAPVGQCQPLCPWAPLCGLSFCLHMAWLLLCWSTAARFQMLTDAFFSKAWTDGCKQFSECI